MSVPFVFSYIDPVSGAILLQVVVAGVLGCIAFFRRSIWRVVRLVLPKRQSDENSSTGDDAHELPR